MLHPHLWRYALGGCRRTSAGPGRAGGIRRAGTRAGRRSGHVFLRDRGRGEGAARLARLGAGSGDAALFEFVLADVVGDGVGVVCYVCGGGTVVTDALVILEVVLQEGVVR